MYACTMSGAGVQLVGESEAMQSLRDRLARVAPTPLPVLLLGETGTGKEVAARWLHQQSERAGSFVAVDCAALSPNLVESELFGHERGAFTGAARRREGLVAAARGGTFFLDEVGELTLEAQTRLLRLLEQQTYRPVGALEEERADIRVVAATWRDLRARVDEGAFREDLYHRLTIVELMVPPLRERPSDVDLLLERFMEGEAAAMARPNPELTRTVRRALHTWPWPGNVRELKNVARYMVAMTPGSEVGIEDLPPSLRRPPPRLDAPSVYSAVPGFDVRIDLPYMEARRRVLDAFQHRYVDALLEAHEGNVSAAARAAGMDRRSIQRILSRSDPCSESAE